MNLASRTFICPLRVWEVLVHRAEFRLWNESDLGCRTTFPKDAEGGRARTEEQDAHESGIVTDQPLPRCC